MISQSDGASTCVGTGFAGMATAYADVCALHDTALTKDACFH